MNYSGVRGQRRTVKDKKSRSIPESTNDNTIALLKIRKWIQGQQICENQNTFCRWHKPWIKWMWCCTNLILWWIILWSIWVLLFSNHCGQGKQSKSMFHFDFLTDWNQALALLILFEAFWASMVATGRHSRTTLEHQKHCVFFALMEILHKHPFAVAILV